MKKICVWMLAIMMAFGMTGCTSNQAAETPAATEAPAETEKETEAAAEETTEAAAEAVTEVPAETKDPAEEFGALMEAIYNVRPGSAGSSLRAEEAGESLKNFAFTYGVDAKAESFRELAANWLDNNSVKADDMIECLDSTIGMVKEQNQGIETDLAFLNVINGILEELNARSDSSPVDAGDPDTEEDGEDMPAEAQEARDSFFEVLDLINNIRPGTAGSSLRIEPAVTALVNFVFDYGLDADSSSFETLTDEWFEERGDAAVKENFLEDLEAAQAGALAYDETLEEDVAYLNVMNGIQASAGK